MTQHGHYANSVYCVHVTLYSYHAQDFGDPPAVDATPEHATHSEPIKLKAYYIVSLACGKNRLEKQMPTQYFYAETYEDQPAERFDPVLEKVPKFFANEYAKIGEHKGCQANNCHSQCN